MPGIKRPSERVESWDDQVDNAISNQIRHRANYERVLSALRPRSGEALLDIGCGNGLLLSVALSLGLHPTGIEDTPEAAAISQKAAPQAHVVVGSETSLPFENNHFDLVTALDFLDFFPDPEEGLEEVRRVLKLGGRACILLPNGDFLGKNQAEQQMNAGIAFSLKIWKNMLESAGLKVVAVHPNFSRTMPEQPLGLAWLVQNALRLLWRFMPRRFSDQFICYCYKD